MALQFNQYSKQGLIQSIKAACGSTSVLYLYLTDVSYPAVAPSNPLSSYTATYTNLTSSISGNSIILSGNLSYNSVKSGTISWFHLHNGSLPANGFISDSVGLSGSGSILTVNTINPSVNSTITVSFSLSMI